MPEVENVIGVEEIPKCLLCFSKFIECFFLGQYITIAAAFYVSCIKNIVAFAFCSLATQYLPAFV